MVGRSILASRVVPVAGFLAALLLAGCTAPRENSLLRAERERSYRTWEYKRDQLDRETERLRQYVEEGAGKAQELRDQAAVTASHTRDEMTRLGYELTLLQNAEKDLAAAKARLAGVQKEQQPVVAAIAALEQHKTRLKELQAEVQKLDQQVAAAEASLKEKTAAAQARLLELAQQQQQVDAFGAAVEKAKAEVAAAATPLVPPPPPAPAAQPAKK